jgi:nucleotide-binding universal stress UspA family protein
MSTASDRANGSYRILVAFDNSAHAWRALEQAVELAKQRDAELTFMTPTRSFAAPRRMPTT